MSTAAQVLASRANGALSQGPLSPETKAISSRNSLKLGIHAQSMIIPGEDPEALERLTTEYNDDYNPVGPVECAVLRGHPRRVDAQTLRPHRERRHQHRAAAHTETEFAVAAAFEQDAKSGNTLQRLFRRQKAGDKDWFEALKLLEKIQDSASTPNSKSANSPANSPPAKPPKPLPKLDPPTLGFVLTTDRNPSCNPLPRPVHNRPRRRSRTSGYRL